MKKKAWSFLLVTVFLLTIIPQVETTTIDNSDDEDIDGNPKANCIGKGRRRVTIIRDNYGVPHIYARSKEGLAYGCGYAVAQDRLWQALNLVWLLLIKILGNVVWHIAKKN